MTPDQAPDALHILLQTGLAHHQRGELAEAQSAYDRVLAKDPRQPDALHLTGLVAHQRGDTNTGIRLIEAAIDANPGAIAYYTNWATLLVRAGRQDRAFTGLLAAAERRFSARDFAVAEACCRRALELNPTSAPAHVRLAAALTAQDRLEEALAQLDRAIQLDAADPSPRSLAGVGWLSLGEIELAIASFEAALALDPAFAPARYNLGVALLLRGDLRRGWREYEARGASVLFANRRGQVRQPIWDGEPLEGKRIFVQAEQGFGDAIQFVRHVPRLARRGGKVILECRPELRILFQGLPGLSSIVTTEEPLPDFDVQVPLLSLPRIFGTTSRTVPAKVPYLAADPAKIALRRQRLQAYPGLKVGLSWRGSRANIHDARRSIPSDLLSPLADAAGVHFFAVHKREPGDSPLTLPPGMPVIDLDPMLGDFSDTAALLESLHLVISVDTAMVHLAGALARPVWVLLPFVPDWRWQMNRPDSPWYPTARLFRQPARGAWAPLLQEVREALRQLVSGL